MCDMDRLLFTGYDRYFEEVKDIDEDIENKIDQAKEEA